MQRGEAKILLEQWEGAVEDLKHAINKDNQVHVKYLQRKSVDSLSSGSCFCKFKT